MWHVRKESLLTPVMSGILIPFDRCSDMYLTNKIYLKTYLQHRESAKFFAKKVFQYLPKLYIY